MLTGDRAFLSKLLGQYAADTARDTLANATRLLPKDASDDEKNQAYEFGAEMLQRMYPACARSRSTRRVAGFGGFATNRSPGHFYG